MDYPNAIEHLAKVIYPEQIIHTIIPSNIHHRLIKTRKKKYYLLKKDKPYLTTGKFFEDNKGWYLIKVEVRFS